MNTYTYCVARYGDQDYRVTEADGPSAPATGTYESVVTAMDAVAAVAVSAGLLAVDLNWDYDPLDYPESLLSYPESLLTGAGEPMECWSVSFGALSA